MHRVFEGQMRREERIERSRRRKEGRLEEGV